MRSKEDIEEEIEKVLKLYESNDDWKGYLDQLQNKEGIEEELSKIFGYKDGQ